MNAATALLFFVAGEGKAYVGTWSITLAAEGENKGGEADRARVVNPYGVIVASVGMEGTPGAVGV